MRGTAHYQGFLGTSENSRAAIGAGGVEFDVWSAGFRVEGSWVRGLGPQGGITGRDRGCGNSVVP